MPAPAGFLEMCERSPIDCEHSRPIDAVVIKTMARAAISAQIDQLFSGMGGNQEGVTATIIAAQPAPTEASAQAPDNTTGHFASDVAATTAAALMPAVISEPQPQNLRWANKSENGTTDAAQPATPLMAAYSQMAPRHETPAQAQTKRPNDYRRIDYDKQTQSIVQAVNDRVNRTLVSDTDEHVYHTTDYWTAPGIAPGTRGDCEDYALEKRRLLIEAGIPADALSLATVKTPFDEDHAVLVLSTVQGDLVLDNLQYGIKDWRRTDYTWISRQSALDDLSWVSLDHINPRASRMRAPDARIAYNQ